MNIIIIVIIVAIVITITIIAIAVISYRLSAHRWLLQTSERGDRSPPAAARAGHGPRQEPAAQ